MGKDWLELRYPAARLISSLVFVSIFLGSQFARAQVGRGPKSTAPTTERTTPTPTESPTKPSEKSSAQAKLVLVVTKLVASPSLTIETRIGVESFVERLKLSSDVEVQPVAKDESRGEAITQAKTQHDAYVIWLTTEVDTPYTETASIATINSGCVFISYTVYSPQTAKVKTQGRTYQQGYVPQGCVASASRPAPAPSETHRFQLPYEERLKRAGHEAANRVLRAFNLKMPTTDP